MNKFAQVVFSVMLPLSLQHVNMGAFEYKPTKHRYTYTLTLTHR